MQARLLSMLLAQREMHFAWVPVWLGVGIGVYFLQKVEPDAVVLAALALLALACLIGARRVAEAFAPLLIATVLVIAGFGVAKFRAEAVAAPQLTFRYYGPIEGRVVGIDRSASDALRLTLDRVVLARMSPERTPARVRISLHGDQPIADVAPGETLILTGHLSPPAGPAEPGGFDFQRHAWFLGIGAVGYTRTPVLRLAVPDRMGPAMRIFAWRMALSEALQTAMPGPTGGFAAAIMTGDRSGIAEATYDDLRRANLAHLLAISGLHMGLLTGFIFALVRYGLALVPIIALRLPTKKIAALCALVAGAFYLALSGGNVATERAFVMVAVMLVAVLLDRRALTLRAVAIAAVIVLVWQPEALTGPGFQMSFAATTALVAAFSALRRVDLRQWPKWSKGVLSVVLSSFVAGLATAPFAAAHFNQIPHYGLLANVVSVPLMGALVMPAGVLALCLAPFGLWEIGLWIMQKGLSWILFVAETVSGWEGSVSHIFAPQAAVLPLLGLGLLGVLLLQGWLLRIVAGGTVLAAALLWGLTTRPAVLVADNGALIGVMTDQGRALSRASGSGFVAGIWLENDGWPVPQEVAADR
ncbi:ComEC/Rec2 family competence protein, partial [Yoonia sp.]|uniref:ComEC/Rec2 family competence protein n=1 Tax=Yoonia sp. TaxID=2212373 RepID=UPI002FDA43CE